MAGYTSALDIDFSELYMKAVLGSTTTTNQLWFMDVDHDVWARDSAHWTWIGKLPDDPAAISIGEDGCMHGVIKEQPGDFRLFTFDPATASFWTSSRFTDSAAFRDGVSGS